MTWYEAEAFCHWLSETLAMNVELQRGAVGEGVPGGGREMYPWGKTYDAAKVNGGDAGIGSTTAVGLFRQEPAPMTSWI